LKSWSWCWLDVLVLVDPDKNSIGLTAWPGFNLSTGASNTNTDSATTLTTSRMAGIKPQQH
jgi:hypothetical protein